METLSIDRATPIDTLFSFIGAERATASREAGRVILTPEENDTGNAVNPDGIYINPDDYPDTTAYLNAIPGMADMLIKSKNLPDSEFEEWV